MRKAILSGTRSDGADELEDLARQWAARKEAEELIKREKREFAKRAEEAKERFNRDVPPPRPEGRASFNQEKTKPDLPEEETLDCGAYSQDFEQEQPPHLRRPAREPPNTNTFSEQPRVRCPSAPTDGGLWTTTRWPGTH